MIAVSARKFNDDLLHFEFALADGTAVIGTFVVFMVEFFDVLLRKSFGNLSYFLAQVK